MPAFAGMTVGGFGRVSSSRHPRESWDPETSEPCFGEALDARVRGHDGKVGSAAFPQVVIPAKAGIQRLQSHASVKPWMPAFAGMTGKVGSAAFLQAVIPAKAGIQRLQSHASLKPWMPAFAGMTARWVRLRFSKPSSPRKRGSRDFRAMLR